MKPLLPKGDFSESIERKAHAEKQALAKRLLDEGAGIRTAARASGLSRHSVQLIKLGVSIAPVACDLETDAPQVARCPGCGAMVEMPCVVCATRSHIAVYGYCEQLDALSPGPETDADAYLPSEETILEVAAELRRAALESHRLNAGRRSGGDPGIRRVPGSRQRGTTIFRTH